MALKHATLNSSLADRRCCAVDCRQITKHSSHRRAVFYLAPCHRRLRNESEVDRYLVVTDSKLTIDLFCFDTDLRIDVEFMSKQVTVDCALSLCVSLLHTGLYIYSVKLNATNSKNSRNVSCIKHWHCWLSALSVSALLVKTNKILCTLTFLSCDFWWSQT